MFKMINTTLQAIVEITSEEIMIIVKQSGKIILSATNCFKMILSEEFQQFKDCYVKKLKITGINTLLIEIESPEEREATERMMNWEKEIEERRKQDGQS